MRRVPLPMQQPFLVPRWCPWPIVMPGSDPRILQHYFEGCIAHGTYTERTSTGRCDPQSAALPESRSQR